MAKINGITVGIVSAVQSLVKYANIVLPTKS